MRNEMNVTLFYVYFITWFLAYLFMFVLWLIQRIVYFIELFDRFCVLIQHFFRVGGWYYFFLNLPRL